ncbi:MAG: GAF domain-containing protein [Bacteroidota bacterium]
MAESLLITPGATRAERYTEILPQIKAVIADEPNLVANLANIAAILREGFGFFWVGFYLRDGNKDELVLGPFQGPLACTRIAWGRGVCGTAAQTGESQLVPNVHQFPGHIACSSASQSEVVIPLMVNDTCQMVLDIDSDQLEDFSTVDVKALEGLMELLKEQHFVA